MAERNWTKNKNKNENIQQKHKIVYETHKYYATCNSAGPARTAGVGGWGEDEIEKKTLRTYRKTAKKDGNKFRVYLKARRSFMLYLYTGVVCRVWRNNKKFRASTHTHTLTVWHWHTHTHTRTHARNHIRDTDGISYHVAALCEPWRLSFVVVVVVVVGSEVWTG